MNILEEYARFNAKFPITTFAQERFVKPTESDYKKGEMIRYFVRNITGIHIIETDRTNWFSCSDMLYEKVTLTWKLAGEKTNTYVGDKMQSMGVWETNIATINIADKILPGIRRKIKNPLQFYNPK